jgi:hypothetical protein
MITAARFALICSLLSAIPLLYVGLGTECELYRGERLGMKLEATRHAIFAASSARKHVTECLLRGELSLRQAASRFRLINTSLPYRFYLDAYTGASDEEKLCRCVLRYVESILADQPAERDGVLSRLQAELHTITSED